MQNDKMIKLEKFYVYKMTNVKNNKVYIGKTNDLNRRLEEHLDVVKRGVGSKDYYIIHAAINKYGIENFIIEIIEVCEIEKISFEREIYFVALYKSNIHRYGSDFGYNMTDGGEGPTGRKASQETRKKLSESHKGYIMPEWQKKKISESNKGKIVSEETRKKLSQSKKGRKLSEEQVIAMSGENSVCFGKTANQDMRKKLSEAQLKRGKRNPLSEENKQKIRENNSKRDMSYRIQPKQKKEIIKLWNTCQYTKQQIADNLFVDYARVHYVIKHNVSELKKQTLPLKKRKEMPQEARNRVLETRMGMSVANIDKLKNIIIDKFINEKIERKNIAILLNVSYSYVKKTISKYLKNINGEKNV